MFALFSDSGYCILLVLMSSYTSSKVFRLVSSRCFIISVEHPSGPVDLFCLASFMAAFSSSSENSFSSDLNVPSFSGVFSY